MAEYIEREAALALVQPDDPADEKAAVTIAVVKKLIRHAVNNTPAADVAPVVHGRWEHIPQTLNTLSQLRCPFCGWWSLDPSINDAYNYCPNCGAKMDESMPKDGAD